MRRPFDEPALNWGQFPLRASPPVRSPGHPNPTRRWLRRTSSAPPHFFHPTQSLLPPPSLLGDKRPVASRNRPLTPPIPAPPLSTSAKKTGPFRALARITQALFAGSAHRSDWKSKALEDTDRVILDFVPSGLRARWRA